MSILLRASRKTIDAQMAVGSALSHHLTMVFGLDAVENIIEWLIQDVTE